MRIAVIPARGGSKRIPRKNVRTFVGKPIIAYSIRAAQQSACFDRILVSTDDDEIADVAEQHDAEVPFRRPTSLADDYTGTNAVVRHAVEWFESQGQSIEYACCIYATAPFIQASYLRAGLERLVSSGREFAFSVTTFAFPIQRALRLDEQGAVEAVWPQDATRRSQDLEETFHDAGQFYWGRAEAFLSNTVLYSPASLGVVLPRHLVQDIDTPEDWKRAELMFRSLVATGDLEA